MELSTLEFTVNTAQLKEAHALLKSLGPAMAEVGKGSHGAAKGVEGMGNSSAGLKKTTDLLGKLDMLAKDLADGFTRGEASLLRLARQTETPLDQVKNRLTDIRKLVSDPFDSSTGSVRSITMQFEALENRAKLAGEGIAFTAKQLREYSRIPFEVEGKVKASGLDPAKGEGLEVYTRRLQEEQQAYLNLAKNVSVLDTAEKERNKTIKDSYKANQFLGTEMQRADAILAELNQKTDQNRIVSDKTADSVARYARQIELAGIKGPAAAKELEVYRKKMVEIEKFEQMRAKERLSNALAPQISDVAVSIAGGMPLHLIAMQQGLQIRDLIGSSKVATQDLEEVMRSAMKNMVVSIGGTIAAMGQLTFGAMKDLGDAAINMPVKLLGWEKGLAAIEAENVKLTKSFRYLVAGGVGLAATALSVAAYETIKMIGVNNDLTRQLAQTGGVFGVASANVDAYNFSMVNAGISMRESSEIMTLMAASSNLSISSFDMIKVSAENMSKYAGVAIKDTVAAFDKMAGDPVKALTELAIKTGSVDSETLKLVYTLEKQGNMAQAAAVGMQALADHNSKAAKKMQEDLHPLTLTFIKIGDFYDKWSSLVLPDFDFMSRGGHKQRDVQSEINKIKNIPEWRRTKEDKEKIEHLEEQLRLLNKQQDVDVFRAQENSRNARREKADAALREQTLTKEAKITSDIEKMRKNILFGEVSKDEGEAYIKKLEGDLSDLKKKESKKQVREAERASAYEKTALEQLSDAYNQKALKDLDPVQKKLLDLMNDPKFLQQSVHVREEIESQAAEYSRLLGIQTQATNNNLASEFASEKLSEAYSKTVGNLKNLTEVEREYLNLKDNPKYQKASKETQDRIDQEAERYIKLTKSILLAKDAQEGLKQIREAEQQLEDLRFEDSVSRRSEREQQVERATYALKKQMRLSDYQLQTDLDKALNESDETLMFQQIDRAYRLHELRKKLYGEQFDISTRQMTDMEKRAKSYDNVFQNTFEKIGDAMATSFITGKDTFKDMIDNMLADLLRLEIKMQMMKMYESMGGGSKDGILGALLKLGVSTATGSPTSGATTDVTAFARGGVVNRTTSFGMRGGGMGIAGEAGPEAILPLTRTSNGNLGVAAQASSSNVQIVINNNSAASISQKETVDSRGNRRVELTVSEMVAGEVKRNGSMMQRSMSNTFGSKPTLISR